MNNSSIEIKYSLIGNGNVFVSIFVNGKDANFQFGLCEFANEMEFIGIKTKFEKIQSQSGFTFSETVDTVLLEREIKAFATRFKIV